MQLITLTTDFGTLDHYAASLKGALLSVHPIIQFIDITHNVKNYNIVQSAYVVKHTFSKFPPGTIHIVAVNTFYEAQPRYLVALYRGHYFIGPDNGVFSMIFEEAATECVTITTAAVSIHMYELAYAKAVEQITKQLPLAEIGTPVGEIMQRFSLQAITGETMIRGSVIHIDHFENVVLNITRELWNRYAYFRRFTLFFKRNDPIIELSTTYSDVPIGENLCLFNAADHLEIAINMGKAAGMLSLDIEDTIQVEFY